ASVMRCLLDNLKENKIKVNNIICSDLNNDLINLWNIIKTSPEAIFSHYNVLWNELNSTEDKAVKRAYFEQIRDRLNKEHNPMDFMFILRTTTNGMPRYNSKGEFNNSFHITRNGIKPDTFKKIIYEWAELLNQYNVEFKCHSFEGVSTNENDFVFVDPPYANTKGMYFGNFNNVNLFNWLKHLNCKWIMTYDGKSGDVDNTYNVPEEVYKEHIYLKSGNSSFKRTIGKSNDSIVYESLYKNY
ncbi:MAG: DNA adenine methylase, partial [Bacilli bacterium]|nr:DNA adenine methylase [Bacilli bacterium]